MQQTNMPSGPVKTVDGFVNLAGKARGSGNILLLVKRGDNSQFVAVTPK